MNLVARPGVLIVTLVVSGCVQEVAPRHQVQVASESASLEKQASTPAPLAAPVEVATVSMPQLETRILEDPEPEVRREAVFQVADMGASEDAAVIGQALYDPDSDVRLAAVEALTGIGDESAADWMLVPLGDPDPRIRRTAVEALGEIRGGTAKLLLQQALLDADEGVREAARQMLEEPEFADPGIR